MATIRKLCEDDLPSVFQVALAAGVKMPPSYELWRDQFLWSAVESRRLFAEPSCPLGLVATDADTVVGFAGLGYRRLRVNGIDEPAAVHTSLAVRPDAQGLLGLLLCRELAKLLTREAAGYRILGLHHSETVGKVWSRLGARCLDGSDMTCRMLASPGHVLADRLGLPAAAASLLDLPPIRVVTAPMFARHGYGAAMPADLLPRGISVSQAVDFERAIGDTDFLRRCLDKCSIGIKRDADYLRWRYGRGPVGRYRFFAVTRDGAHLGLVILGADGRPTARLFEALFARDADLDARSMARFCLAAAARAGAGVLVAKVTEPALARAWQADGAVIDRKDYGQFWYTGNEAETVDIRYTYGDFTED